MNSEVALADAAKLVSKLIARTREGKITWNASAKHRTLSALETCLEGNLRVTVWMANRDSGFRVSRIQADTVELPATFEELETIGDPDTALLSISLQESYRKDYDFPEEEGIYRQLVELHELARRSAYRMDAQFEDIYNYLDRLAG